MIETDVLVVGAGPAGAMTAGGLARLGYGVLAVDRAAFPRDKACAEYCGPGVADVLRRAGVWADVAPRSRACRSMTVYVGGSPVLPIAYSHGSISRTAFTIPRIDLDHVLVEAARRHGAEIAEETRVRGVTPERKAFSVTCLSREGQTLTIRSPIVVAADGVHSPTARMLGIRAAHHWPHRLGLITHYSFDRVPITSGEMHVGPGAYCGLAPLAANRLNVGLVLGKDVAGTLAGPRQDRFYSGLNLLPAAAGRLTGGTMAKPIRGIGPMTRRVDRVAGAGFLLVGDAAGFLDPFTGEGLFRAMRGAELAVEAIDQAMKQRDASDVPDLTRYVTQRRNEFVAKERFTWLIQLALTRPLLFAGICRTLARSDTTIRRLGNVLGDLESAQTLLSPWPALDLLLSRQRDG